MRRLLGVLFLFVALGCHATEPVQGDVISGELHFGSSGFWGQSPFVSLPKGQWKLIEKEYLSGKYSSHRGYLLESVVKDSAVPLLAIVWSVADGTSLARTGTQQTAIEANNYWVSSFSAIPANAEGVNQYGTSPSSMLTKQSFYFKDFALSNYQTSWLHELKAIKALESRFEIKSFAISVTRNIRTKEDIRIISFIRKPTDTNDPISESSQRFFQAIEKWNDALVQMSYDSTYERKKGIGSEVAFAFRSDPVVEATAGSPRDSKRQDDLNGLTGEPSKQQIVGSQAAELEASREREARLKAELELARLKLELEKGKDASTNISSEVSATLPLPSTSKENSSKQTQLSNQRLALVIGNDSYKNVPKLENAVGDAKAISSLLAGLGYEVLTFNNLNEKEFKRSLRQFKQRLKGGEEVVFFFAGHGVQIGSANYLLPTDVGSDSEDQIQDEGIPLQRVLDDFSESKVKFSLAMVDACRDNPFKSTGRSIGGRGLAATSAATGQMVIFSAGVGQQALDRLGNNDKAKNGLFTRVLIDKVSQSKEPIHILMRDVRAEVAKLAQSVGHDQVPAIYDQVIGDFYFANKK